MPNRTLFDTLSHYVIVGCVTLAACDITNAVLTALS